MMQSLIPVKGFYSFNSRLELGILLNNLKLDWSSLVNALHWYTEISTTAGDAFFVFPLNFVFSLFKPYKGIVSIAGCLFKHLDI